MSGVTVCMCVYQRRERLPQMIRELQAQTVKPAALLIWDNVVDHPDGATGNIPVTSFPISFVNRTEDDTDDGPRKNWGSQARFWLVEYAETDTILFLDDDGVFPPDLIEHTLSYYERYSKKRPCVVGSHTRYIEAEKYLSPHRKPQNSDLVDYVGTMGMMVSKKLFTVEPSLTKIPKQCERVEDLYLSAMARKHGYDLYHIPKKYQIESDQKDQFLTIGKTKQASFEWLRKNGWKLLREINPGAVQ